MRFAGAQARDLNHLRRVLTLVAGLLGQIPLLSFGKRIPVKSSTAYLADSGLLAIRSRNENGHRSGARALKSLPAPPRCLHSNLRACRRRKPLAITSSETPMSEAMAAHNDA